MQSHRGRRRRIRALVLGLAACTAIAAQASAQPIRDTPAHYPGAQPAPTIKIGDTPADFAQPVARPADSKAEVGETAGDTPVDHPGAALLVALGGCTFLLVATIRRRRPGH